MLDLPLRRLSGEEDSSLVRDRRRHSGRIETQTRSPTAGVMLCSVVAVSGPSEVSIRIAEESQAITRPSTRLVSPMNAATARERGRR